MIISIIAASLRHLIEKIKIQELLRCCPLWGGRIFLDTMTLENSRKNLIAKGKLAVWLAFEERNFVWNRIAKAKLTIWLAIEERVCSMELHLLTRVASKNFKKLTNLFELFFARGYWEIPVILFLNTVFDCEALYTGFCRLFLTNIKHFKFSFRLRISVFIVDTSFCHDINIARMKQVFIRVYWEILVNIVILNTFFYN